MELGLRHAVIRGWRLEDILSLVHHANNRRAWRNLRDQFPHPYTVSDADPWIRQATQTSPETHFGVCRVCAGVFEWNPASMRMLEKAGYSCEGRLRKSVTKEGQTIDQILYAIVREP